MAERSIVVFSMLTIVPLLTHVQNSSGVWPVFKHRAWEDLRATEKPPSYRASYAAGKEALLVPFGVDYSTVTDLAKLRGWSTS